ncbi:hypothetical protein [Falsirhodobacter deserti]|uniref:hypothetical protein n=1 Tax=Falsirhodobacter deserti TaxID=1365611 RepID=UPI0013E3200E|nr:hypothetical protein [Falsirhodobacter deserti]
MKLPKPAIQMAQSLCNSLRTSRANLKSEEAPSDPQPLSTRRSAWTDFVRKAALKIK